jgi:anti-sigma factor RsiW
MTNCERIETDLIAYLDAQADPAARRKVEAHLAECADCRKRAEEFRALWSVLDELPAAEPSAGFDARVRARIAAEPERRSWWRMLRPSPRLAFATAALMAMSVWMLTIHETRRQMDTSVELAGVTQGSEAEFRIIQNLPELENYDLLSNFDVLSDLPAQTSAPAAKAQ